MDLQNLQAKAYCQAIGVIMSNHKHFTLFDNRWFTLFREQAGVISKGPCWVLFYGCYGHYSESLIKLLIEAAREYKDDKHLAM